MSRDESVMFCSDVLELKEALCTMGIAKIDFSLIRRFSLWLFLQVVTQAGKRDDFSSVRLDTCRIT